VKGLAFLALVAWVSFFVLYLRDALWQREPPYWLERLVVSSVCLLSLLLIGAVLGSSACAATPAQPVSIKVPEASVLYRLRVERAANDYFGISASPARLAAQLHQESAWRPDARSKYASGLAQFTPATAKWLPAACPEIGTFDPWDPSQSIRAAACYDRWLYDRVTGASECDRWAFALSAYNGGLGWVNRDRRRASATGADGARWFGHVELHTSRASWARDENRSYVRRILLRIEPAYIAAGWSGAAVCAQ
jgi:soluble lytic murein transglycosylase-like protein